MATSQVITTQTTLQATSQAFTINNVTLNLSYLESTEAKKTFGYFNPEKKEDDNVPVRDIMYDRIIKLRKAALTAEARADS